MFGHKKNDYTKIKIDEGYNIVGIYGNSNDDLHKIGFWIGDAIWKWLSPQPI